MDGPDANRALIDWDEANVQQWFSSLGFPQYERQINEHNVRGDTLCMLDADGLKALGVATVGQRLSILKSLYYLKVSQGIPLDEDDYVPPSEASGPPESVAVSDLHSAVKDQSQRLRSLEEENRTLTTVMVSFLDEIVKLRTSLGLPSDSLARIRRQIPYLREDVQSATRPALQTSPLSQTPPSESSATAYATPSSSAQDTPDNGNMKVSLDDPTWKVLPAALKKHRINNDDWQNYAMFISYGPQGNRIKRRLDLNEKPLFLFKKLKDAKKNPAFVLKNMKDLRSPMTDDNNSANMFSASSQDPSTPGQRYNLQPTRPLSIRSGTPELSGSMI